MLNVQSVKLSLKKNDHVQVIAGREKGKTGKVLKVDRKNSRVVVERVNLVKRHVKPSQQNPQGGIVEKESSVHYSNVLLFCIKCNRGVRHGVKLVSDGKPGKEKPSGNKTRVCKRCGESLEGVS